YIEETIEGMKVVKVFNHEDECLDEFKELNANYRESATRANFLAGIIMPVMNNLNNIAYALTAMIGGTLAVASGFSVGSLVAFLQYSRQFSQPINQITNQMNNVFSALAGAERVFDVMQVTPEVDEGTVTLTQQDGKRYWKDGETLIPVKGEVRFNNVAFSYNGENVILHDISLYAKPGQKIAFVGSTGAGKTTITNLINRFYDIQEGEITCDGIDIKRIQKDALRSTQGIVLQDTHLFTGTVMENIRYGRLNATDEECIAAAKQVSAHSFIRRLPDGYQTEITGDGGNLSQGQRQLLAIARAAVAAPPVMILDEATSSIDTRTERLIEKGMDVLMEGRTVFVIAHRLSTVRNSNAIMVLENGRIIERGDHDSLMDEKGRYYELCTGKAKLT
ncbi:MAG: ABC transporter ATP-binding protein/permease, partial [Clostridiales bacterium]|nr:ABC transporter ATP-binding protein/permease [Clostridiales bacterium]